MDVLKQQTADCDFIRFTWSDIHGMARGRYIPRDSVPQCLEEGIAMYASTQCFGPRGQLVMLDRVTANFDNVLSKAIPSTFHVLPWAGAGKYKVGEVLCETEWSPTEKVGACTRSIARRQVERLAEQHGYSVTSGWEFEFFVLHTESQKPLFDGLEYVSLQVMSENEEVYLDMVSLLNKADLGVASVNIEYAPGQVELTTKPVKGMLSVDSAFNLKEGVKEIVAQHGLQATFMSKPYPDKSGSGLHLNLSFTNQSGQNIFSDPNSDDKLSDFAHHFLGGLMKHASAVSTLSSPTFNCYRRLHQPWAPTKGDWAVHNRTVAVRVKLGPSGPYLESRLPGAAANPYLVMASHLAAGLDGVSKKIECPPQLDKSATSLPHNLKEALQALEDDVVMCEAMGSEFIEWFLIEKRTVELEELKDCDLQDSKPDALKKEHDMYFKFI